MKMTIPYASLYKKVQIILQNKIEEFHYLGYTEITERDLWNYCIDKMWRKEDIQNLRLHQIASGIFNVSGSEIIQYQQLQGLKQSSFDMKISEDDFKNLFQQLPLNLSKNDDN